MKNLYCQTDAPVTPIQHFSYLPFGELQIEQKSCTWGNRYTFSGKEKDTESGYSYFWARYYNSDLSIWLSVDPMSDKYPHQSNYVYCSNNPIRLIDPNGEDEWELNKSGHIRFVEGSEGKPDKMFAIDNKGNRITDKKGNEKSVNVDKDIMNSLESGKENISGKDVDYSSLNVTGKEDIAKGMFKFMSNNTDVEWSYWGGTKNEENFATISTSHKKFSDKYSTHHSIMSSLKNGLSFFFHTHPRSKSQGMYSNDQDRIHSSICKIGSPNAIIGLIHKGTLYELDRPYKIQWDGKRK